MQYKANTPEEYISQLPEDRKDPITKLRNTILKNIPKGFEETIGYGMVAYVVPRTIYPEGYHCDPKLPLPFMNLASQKNFIAVYNMGIYVNIKVYDWFVNEYPKHCKRKLDMGKSCIRFKYIDEIPYELIGELASKITVEEWINSYESNIKNR